MTRHSSLALCLCLISSLSSLARSGDFQAILRENKATECHTIIIEGDKDWKRRRRNKMEERLDLFVSSSATPKSFQSATLFSHQAKYDTLMYDIGPNPDDYCKNFIVNVADVIMAKQVLMSILNDVLGRFLRVIIVMSDHDNVSAIFGRSHFGHFLTINSNGTVSRYEPTKPSTRCGHDFRDCHLQSEIPDNDPPNFSSLNEGYGVKILQPLFQSRNISWSVKYSKEPIWGGLDSNGEYTGQFKDFYQSKLDSSVAMFSVLYSRSKVVDYIWPLTCVPVHLMTLRPGLKPPDFETYGTIFDTMSWTFVMTASLSAFVFIMVMLCLKRRKTKGKGAMMLSLLKTYVAQGMKNSSRWSNRVHQVLFFGSWIMYSQCLSLIYLTALTSILVAPKLQDPVNSLDDVIRQGKTLFTMESTASAQRVKRDYAHVPQESGPLDTLPYKFESGYVVVNQKPFFNETCPPASQYHTSKYPLFSASENYNAYMFKKNSPWLEVMNRHIMRVVETGLYQHNKDMADMKLFDRSSCFIEKGLGSVRLELIHVYFAFGLLSCGLTLGLVVFVFENGCTRRAPKSN